MAKHEDGFFWGVLLGVAAVAITGCVILSRSFRSSQAGSVSLKVVPKSKNKPGPGRGKTGTVRRVAAKK